MARADLYAGTPAAAPLAFTRMTPRLFQSVDVDTATTEIYTLSLHDALPISSASASFPCWISALISFSAAACGEPDTLTGIVSGVPLCRTIGWAAGSDSVTDSWVFGEAAEAGAWGAVAGSVDGGGSAGCRLLHNWKPTNSRSPRSVYASRRDIIALPFRREAWAPSVLDRPHVQAMGVLQRDLHPLLFRRIPCDLAVVDQDHRNAVGVILPGLLLAVDVLFDEIEGELLAQLFEKGLGLVAKRAVGLGVDHHIGCGGGVVLRDPKKSPIKRAVLPRPPKGESARPHRGRRR